MSRQMKIKGVRCRPVSAPTKRPLTTSTGAVTAATLLLIDRETHDGVIGRSYLFSVGKHNLPPIAKLVEAMAEMVKGDEVAPLDLERKLRGRYALLGVHNIVLFAMAGIDMAAWDGPSPSPEPPLLRLLGAAGRPTPCYNTQGPGP